MIFINHLQRQSEYLQKDVEFDANAQIEVPDDTKEREEEARSESRSLAMLKISELEKELAEVTKENNDLYDFLIANSKKEVLDFCKKNNYNAKLVGSTTRSMSMTQTAKQPLMMKSYSLAQVKTLVHEIMASKAALDEKNEEGGTLPILLEEYIYNFFKKKYGLKDLILVEVTSLMDKLKYFAPKSVEIKAFKTILKNEMDEKFYWLLQEIKKVIFTKILFVHFISLIFHSI